jgi:hypothetical protein
MQNYFAIETEVAHRRSERELTAAQEQRAFASATPAQRLRVGCRHTMAILYSRLDSRRGRPSWHAAARGPHLPARICTAES